MPKKTTTLHLPTTPFHTEKRDKQTYLIIHIISHLINSFLFVALIVLLDYDYINLMKIYATLSCIWHVYSLRKV